MRRGLAALLILGLAACAQGGPRLVQSQWARPPVRSNEVRREIAAALERGDRPAVTRGMRNLVMMGAALSVATQARLAPAIDPSAMARDRLGTSSPTEYFASSFTYNGLAQTSSEPFAAVPVEHRLIEGIAWDAATRRLFVGSVIDRRLLVREGEAWRTVQTAAPIGGVFGMAVDAPRRLLWLASSAADPMPDPQSAYSGLVAIDLDRLTEARRVAIPNARLGDVAVARDGTVYASDGQSGAIFRCRPGCTEPETMIPPGILRSPQGMVVWPGRGLYVADYALGLVLVNLRSLRITPLFAQKPEMLDGIDGLVRSGGRLIAIQNGTRPVRIIHIYLAGGGRIVQGVRVLERNVEGWGEPSLGVIAGNQLLYVADAQWERYGPGGAISDGAPPRPTQIRRTQDLFEPILVNGDGDPVYPPY